MYETVMTISGNIVAEPILREVGDGAQCLTFRIASTSRRFDANASEWSNGSTVFMNVQCWGVLATNSAQAIEKGKPVIVQGYLRSSEYLGSDGVKRSTLTLRASDIGLSLTRQAATYIETSQKPSAVATSEESFYPDENAEKPVTSGKKQTALVAA